MSEPKIQIKSNINLALQEIEFETKVMDHIQNETLSFREKRIQEALVMMGWLPPEGHDLRDARQLLMEREITKLREDKNIMRAENKELRAENHRNMTIIQKMNRASHGCYLDQVLDEMNIPRDEIDG